MSAQDQGAANNRGVPADPSVSPADTIRQALTADLVDEYRVDPGTLALIPGSAKRVPRYEIDREALAALDALLAVGERDKAEIARLADRAVCSGCGSDIYDDGGCSHPTCKWGELIPASELPLALQASCDKLAEVRDERDAEIAELYAERERGRQQIALLTEALERMLDCKGGGKGLVSVVGGEPAACEQCADAARAVLAGEEDAGA